MIHIRLTVEQVLQQYPRAFSVFLHHKTKCPGCFMQHFCTLQDVAETYKISPETLMAEMEAVSRDES